jgi:hypothetical protein
VQLELECFSFRAIYLTFLELSALHVNDESLAQKLEDFGKDQSKDDLGKRYFMNVMNFPRALEIAQTV